MTVRLPHPLPLAAVRALALHAQALTAPPDGASPPTLDTIHDLVEQLGCVQIDTLHVVQRSQYLVLWSRLGQYDPADFDRLIFDPDHRRLFEYWMHAASIIPLSRYRFRLPHIRWFREHGSRWRRGWPQKPENAAVIAAVLDRIREEGPLGSADFENPSRKRQSWWDWKPAKYALHYLYDQGKVMVVRRVNFQRHMDLTERVLPDWVDRDEPTSDEANYHTLAHNARALGIADAGQIADYVHMKRGDAYPVIERLLADGVLVEVEAELLDGEAHTLIVHRDNLPALEQAADGALQPERTTFLSPFDSLFWAGRRDQQVWGFEKVLEAYKPASQRIWGYFCLPILHRDRLVGRFDPKLERKNGTLRLKALYLEPGVEPSEDLIADVAGAMRSFMQFHTAHDLVIERSDPAIFGDRLLTAL
ncbi:MAG: YcaQ family DNA glycosylase [Anaerolineae bacterium]|nr:YcaQ family DNA glycosylase [Anaerolineae bacterium]